MKRSISMLIGLIIISLPVFLPLNITDENISHQDGINPQPQAPTISSVTDYMGNTWSYGSSIKCEIGEYYTLYSYWSEDVLSGQLIIYKAGVESFQLDANTTNSRWLNITFLVRAEYDEPTLVQFAFRPSPGTETNKQTYNIEPAATPTIPSSITVDDSVVQIAGKNAIRFSFTSFLDNVGIANYTIGRKSASDNVLVSTSNWDTCTKWNTSTNQATDTEIDQDLTKVWYYGIKAYDRVGLTTGIYAIPQKFTLDNIAPRIDQVKVWINETIIKTWVLGNALNWANNETEIFPDGTFKIEVVTTEELDSISCILNNPIQEKSYSITMTKKSTGTNVWEGTLDLKQPKTESQLTIRNGGYQIELSLEDKMDNVNNTVFTNIFTVNNSPRAGLDPMLIIIIVGVGVAVAAVAVVGVVVLKKKKSAKASTDSDIEISSGPAKKKKGKIYSGASAIGRASGQEADMLQERRGVKSDSSSKAKTVSASKPISSSSSTISSSRPSEGVGIKKPAADAIPETDKDIDALLKGSQQSNAMQMKQAENTMDIQRRMSFLKSKVDGADQNFVLMNVILDQVKNVEVARSTCPTCGHIISPTWARCPYCTLDQNKDNVIQKMKTKKPIGQDMMCPVCKKIIKAQWSRCPYCFVLDKKR